MSSLDLPPRGLAGVIVESAMFLLNALVAFSGNLLVCIAIYRNPRLRSTTNLYIGALAVSDILSATITQPLAAGVLMTGSWVYGPAVCRLYGFFAHFLIYVSVHTMTLTAINRFYRVTKSRLVYNRAFTLKRSLVYIAAVWAFEAVAVLLPVIGGFGRLVFLPEYSACGLAFESDLANNGFNGFQITAYSVVPAVVIIISYVKVSRTIKAHNANIAGNLSTNGRDTGLSVEEIKITNTLFLLVLGFAVCWGPSFVIVLIVNVYYDHMPHVFSFIAAFLLALSSAINPFIYTITNRNFKNEFSKILRLKKVREIHVEPAVPMETRPRASQGRKELGANQKVVNVKLSSQL